jgi:hypothetical protein
VQVRHDEGVANHIGPEPCAVVRKDGGDSSVGERIGQSLSLAKIVIPGADAVANAEGNTDGRKREHPDGPAWSKNLACVEARCMGTARSHV